jgi:hypothetical protein
MTCQLLAQTVANNDFGVVCLANAVELKHPGSDDSIVATGQLKPSQTSPVQRHTPECADSFRRSNQGCAVDEAVKVAQAPCAA